MLFRCYRYMLSMLWQGRLMGCRTRAGFEGAVRELRWRDGWCAAVGEWGWIYEAVMVWKAFLRVDLYLFLRGC